MRSSFNPDFRYVALALALAMQGCASPGPPPSQMVEVQTPGCTRAHCELSNDQGRWLLDHTPGSVRVIPSNQPLRLRCQADEGPAVAQRDTLSSREPGAAAGAVVGGVAGGAAVGAAFGSTALAFIPPLGLIVLLGGAVAGAATGQAVAAGSHVIRYPELISIPLHCAAARPGPPALALGLDIRGLTPAEARSAGLAERGAVLVTAVVADGQAAASGLQPGDIVLAADGQHLADAADLEERVLALPAGATLALTVWRDGRTLALALARWPVP